MINKTAKTLLSDMITSARAYAETITDTTRRITDWSPGSPQWVLLHAVALELSRVWLTLKRAYYSLFTALATGDELSLRALDYGTQRGADVAASTTIRVYCDNAGVNIPAGQTAGTGTGMVFVTIDAATSASPYVDIGAEAQTTGIAGNVRQGTINLKLGTWPSGAGVTAVTNPYAASGGADYESDAQLRARLAQRWKLGARGVQGCYEAWLQDEYPTVLRTLTYLASNLGAVTCVVVKNSGAAYSGGDLTDMNATLVSRVPLHEVATCQNIAFTNVAVVATLVYVGSAGTVTAAIEDALNEYFDWSSWDWGEDIVRSAVLAVIQSVPNVISVNTVAAEINGVPTATIPVAFNSLPKFATFTGTLLESANW